jgi:hypothetical protein
MHILRIAPATRARGLRWRVIAPILAIAPTLGVPLALAAAALSGESIAVADRGNTAGRHYFELYSDFPGGSYGATAYCGNAATTAKREYVSRTQINLSIDEQPSGTSCSFSLFHSPYSVAGIVDRGVTAGRHFYELYGSFEGANTEHPVFGIKQVNCGGLRFDARVEYESPGQVNVSVAQDVVLSTSCQFPLEGNTQVVNSTAHLLAIPDEEIGGVNDRGDSAGERYFELYGRYTGADLVGRTTCNGRDLPTRIAYTSTSQINVALRNFPAGDAWDCAFTIEGTVAGRLSRSPPFHRSSASAFPTMPSFVGIYDWGGRRLAGGDAPVAAGARDLGAAGFSTARFYISPRARGEMIPGVNVALPYGLDTDAFNAACPPGTPFLPCAVRNPVYRDAFAQAGLSTIVLTAGDSVTSGDYGWSTSYLDPQFVRDHASDIIAEYRELTLALYQTQAGSKKTFIVANWEADNLLYCGSAYTYTIDAGFRSRCPIDQVTSSARALAAYFGLRKIGIHDGRALAAQQNLTGVYVADGIEFNSFHMLDGWGPSVLRNIIPDVRPEWASYSAWETMSKLNPGGASDAVVSQELGSLKQFLATNAAPARLMLGEVGYGGSAGEALDTTKAQQIVALQRALSVINGAEIPVATFWVAFNSTAQFDAVTGATNWIHDGLFNNDGSERFQVISMRAAAASLPPQAQPVVAGPVNVGTVGDDSYVELYGNYPRADNTRKGYRSYALCASSGLPEGTIPATVTYESVGQINVAVPRTTCSGASCPAVQRTCRFVVNGPSFTMSAPSIPITVSWP